MDTRKRARVPSSDESKRKRVKEPRLQLLVTGVKDNLRLVADSEQEGRIASALCDWSSLLHQAEAMQQKRSTQEKLTSEGQLLMSDNEPSVVVWRVCSKKFETLGHPLTSEAKTNEKTKGGKVELDWEEALYLLDQERIRLLAPDASLLTLPAAYGRCFIHRSNYGSAHWVSFNFLKRLGFILRRTPWEIVARKALLARLALEHPSQGLTSDEMANVPSIQSEEVLQNAEPPSPGRLSPLSFSQHESSIDSTQSSYSVYKPRKTFSKRDPGEADYILRCLSSDSFSFSSFCEALRSATPSGPPLILSCSDSSLHCSFLKISPENQSRSLLQTSNKSKRSKK